MASLLSLVGPDRALPSIGLLIVLRMGVGLLPGLGLPSPIPGIAVIGVRLMGRLLGPVPAVGSSFILEIAVAGLGNDVVIVVTVDLEDKFFRFGGIMATRIPCGLVTLRAGVSMMGETFTTVQTCRLLAATLIAIPRGGGAIPPLLCLLS